MTSYTHLTNDELLNLTQQREQLTDEARLALDAEIASRRITAEEVRSYARETEVEERVKERRAKRSSYTYETRTKRFLGKKNRVRDSRMRIEEFDTTQWFVLWIPLVPLASYRIRRRFRKWWNPCLSDKLHILETRPRDWQQIRWTWAKTAAMVASIVLFLELVLRRH